MTLYLLDTNIVSSIMREPDGMVAQRMALLQDEDACTSLVVIAELRFGIERRGSIRLSQHLDAVLRFLPVHPWSEPADKAYAALRVGLEAAGTPIGQSDMLIAAHALALGCILVTDNEREFRRVPGLQVENWLHPAAP